MSTSRDVTEPKEILRKKLREEAPVQLPQDDFIIKSLRADKECFASDYIEGVIPPFIKRPLRRAPKKAFTVTGKGVFERREKKPQYTKEEKAGFSKPQPASLGTTTYFPKVFVHGNSQCLAGVFLDKKDFLLTDRNFIYDGGTVGRPYDFDSKESAERYAREKIGKILFSKDDLDKFKEAILAPENKGKYIEPMPRQRWNIDGTSQVFVGSDTLESRLQAQEYARLIRKKLLEKNSVSPEYTIRLFYFLPDQPDLNFKEYTIYEQELDKQEARSIYQNQSQREEKYRAEQYQILLTLTPREVEGALTSRSMAGSHESLSWRLLRTGYIFILEALADKLGKTMVDIIDYATQIPVQRPEPFYHLIRTGYFDAARELRKKYRNGIDLNLRNAAGKTSLYLAVSKNDLQAVVQLIEEGADPNQSCSDGDTPLELAVAKRYADVTRALIERGANPWPENSWILDSPVSLALEKRDFSMAVELLDRISDVNRKDSQGVTLLFLAVELGLIDFAVELLERGADCNSPISICDSLSLMNTLRGCNVILSLFEEFIKKHHGGEIPEWIFPKATPLHIAALRGDEKLIALLLDWGADPDSKTDDGFTARDFAKAMGHEKIAYQLEEQMSSLSPPPAAVFESEEKAQDDLDSAIEAFHQLVCGLRRRKPGFFLEKTINEACLKLPFVTTVEEVQALWRTLKICEGNLRWLKTPISPSNGAGFFQLGGENSPVAGAVPPTVSRPPGLTLRKKV